MEEKKTRDRPIIGKDLQKDNRKSKIVMTRTG